MLDLAVRLIDRRSSLHLLTVDLLSSILSMKRHVSGSKAEITVWKSCLVMHTRWKLNDSRAAAWVFSDLHLKIITAFTFRWMAYWGRRRLSKANTIPSIPW